MGKAKHQGTIARAEQRLRDAKATLRATEEQIAEIEAEGAAISPNMRRQLTAARAELRSAELHEKYGHRPGTPETYAAIEAIAPNRLQWPIRRMHEGGGINDDQLLAAEEICSIAEMIESAVSVRGASFEARVDQSGSGSAALVEHFTRVRLEIIYSQWRLRLPTPKRLVLDMVLTNQPLTATARSYGTPWRAARMKLIDALDRWCNIKDHVWRSVEAQDIEAQYARLGGGMLVLPRPSTRQRAEFEGSEG